MARPKPVEGHEEFRLRRFPSVISGLKRRDGQGILHSFAPNSSLLSETRKHQRLRIIFRKIYGRITTFTEHNFLINTRLIDLFKFILVWNLWKKFRYLHLSYKPKSCFLDVDHDVVLFRFSFAFDSFFCTVSKFLLSEDIFYCLNNFHLQEKFQTVNLQKKNGLWSKISKVIVGSW